MFSYQNKSLLSIVFLNRVKIIPKSTTLFFNSYGKKYNSTFIKKISSRIIFSVYPQLLTLLAVFFIKYYVFKKEKRLKRANKFPAFNLKIFLLSLWASDKNDFDPNIWGSKSYSRKLITYLYTYYTYTMSSILKYYL